MFSLASSQQAGLGWQRRQGMACPHTTAQSCCAVSRCSLRWRSALSSGIAAPDTQAWLHAAPRARPAVAAAAFGAGALGRGSGEAPAAGQWTEPVQDGLSAADRAILALARAAADVGNKAAAERAAASQGLALVTSSDAWLAPLMPPMGATIDEDAEAGDGMAMALPLERLNGGGSGGNGAVQQQRNSLASGASALLSAVLKPRAASSASGNGAAASSGAATASTSASSNGTGLVLPAPAPGNPIITRRGAPATVPRVSGSGSESDRIVNLAHLAAAGGGGDTTDSDASDDDDMAYAPAGTFAASLAAARNSAGQVGSKAAAAGKAAAANGAAASSTLLGSATAAWNRVAAAASGAPAVGRAKAVAAGAATAASAAAHMAGAAVAKATSQLTPNYGDPSSSWLVGDDVEVPGREVRYIAIAAGPELRRRSARELTSELVNFESYNLGAKVNKRLYAEATALYARFMPLVMDFLEAHPHGSVCFGGQGVGGSLAVLLQLMCCHRGLRFARLLPAVAIDAPAVLAQVPSTQRRKWGAAAQGGRDASQSEDLEDELEELMARTVLEELGLPADAVRNILVLPASSSSSGASAAAAQPHSHDEATQRRLLPGTAGNAGSVGGASPHALVVMSGGGAGGEGAGGVVQGKGRDGAEAMRAQVFKLVGKVVQVESLASASGRIKAAAHAAAATSVLSAPIGDARSGGSTMDAENGAGETSAAAAAAAAANGNGRNGGIPPKLDAATVGSIASAAATAMAAAAAEQFKVVGAGALKAATAGKSAAAGVAAGVAASASATASAAASAAGPVGRKAAASVAAAATAAVPAGRKAAASMAAAAVATMVATRPAAPQAQVATHPVMLSADGDEDDASTWGV